MEAKTLIRTYPNIGLAAVNRRLDKEYRIWLLMRHLDEGGKGWCSIPRLRSFCDEHDIMSWQTLRARLKSGDGVFWRLHKGRAYYASLANVADHLDAVDRHSVLLSIDDFRTLGAFRRALLNGFFSGKPKTMSQETIARIVGRSRRQVQRWIGDSGIKKTTNFVLSARHPSALALFASEGYVLFEGRLFKRMPNTYDGTVARGGRVILSKRPEGALTKQPRRYFKTLSAAMRAIHLAIEGHRDAIIFFPLIHLKTSMRSLWSSVLVSQGTLYGSAC